VLAACNVGQAYDDSIGNPFNGRTLTYAMSEALHTKVTGAVGIVGPGDFDDETGEFCSKRTGWTHAQPGVPAWVEEGAELPSQVAESESDPIRLSITQVTDALLPLPHPRFPKRTHISLRVTELRGETRFRLASKALSVVVRDASGNEHAANLFQNGRYLTTANALYEVEPNPTALRVLRSLLWERQPHA
jgi:hypothetical protein